MWSTSTAGARLTELERLEQRAQNGDAPLQLALARLFAAGGQHELARGWYSRLYQSGDPQGLRHLAVSLLQDKPLRPEQGIAMIKSAAAAGDHEAQYMCAGLAAQDNALTDRWVVALRYLNAAAAGGVAPAQRELAMLGHDMPARLAARAFETVSRDPRIFTCRGFASPQECDWLVEKSRPRLGPAEVYDPQTGRGLKAETLRNNSAAAFGILDTGVMISVLRARLRACFALEGHDFEPPMVLRYRTGQQFRPHFDFIDPDQPGLRDDIAQKGQRVATLLISLNEDFTGGETQFDLLDYSFKGARGDALIFWNTDAQGRPDHRTRHAGMPPLEGEKWIFSQWIRHRAGFIA